MSRHTLATRPKTSTPAAPHAAPSGGSPLDRQTRTHMEARFGHDFSSVRIYTDSRAEESAGALGANAYALGSDIVFGAGQYAPGSRDTERLMAHELTHVVQQERFGPGDPSRVSDRADASEREAERVADRAVAGEAVSVRAAPAAALSRSFLDGEDPENDFWGTKSNFGPRAGGTVDSAMNTFWDGAGLIPVVGTALGGVSTGIDLLKAGGSGVMSAFMGMEGSAERTFGMGSGMQADLASERYSHAAGRFAHDAAWDGLGMIPGLGTLMSAGSLGYDVPETISRAAGRAPNPAVGDHWDKALTGAEGLLGF